ncbi:hypothetical protein MNAN1_000390 [Malassezia nana]|uniref:Proteophosphoglycan ppg4 n=1 Tax=Malassezia nana TaxID=180528 RepID=A0AAF0EJC3_9BASI|nr:hypothetical protein MNAN1_000390 [Malassezia nana]
MLGSTSGAQPHSDVDPDQTTFDRASDMDRQQPAPLSVDTMSDSDVDDASRYGPAVSPRPNSTRLYQGLDPRGTGSASSSHFVIVIPPPEMPTATLPRSASAPTLARRGTLLPLYPTLGGQLYAIAREYGLPSVGGISLYLVDDGSGNEGPRIGDSTWAALWSGFFEDEEHESALPASLDMSDSESYVRPTPLPYMRKSQPSPRPRQLSNRESLRRLPRMASNASFTSTRSASAASFTLENGRLPIVGKFEWSVDPAKAKWWRPFMAHAEAVAEMSSPHKVRDPDAPPLPAPRTSGPRPLHLAQMASPSPARAQSISSASAPLAPSTGTDANSIIPMASPVQTRDAPIIAASPNLPPSGDGPEGGQEVLAAPPSVPDILSPPPSSGPELHTAPTSLSEPLEPFQAPVSETPSALGLGSPKAPGPAAQGDVPPGGEEFEDKASTDPSPPADEPLTPIRSAPPPLPARSSSVSEHDDDSKKRSTMSEAVASFSAAASRLFGGHRTNDTAPPQTDASQEDTAKPRTPTSPQQNVEEARERLTERERKSANARRHMQRASIDIPRSVKRASARMSQAMGGVPGPENKDDELIKSHKRSISTPHADAFELSSAEPSLDVPLLSSKADTNENLDASAPAAEPPAPTVPAARFLGAQTQPAPAYMMEEHWMTQQDVRRTSEEALRTYTNAYSAKVPRPVSLAQRLTREGSLRSPILLERNLPSLSSASPVLPSAAPTSNESIVSEPTTEEAVPPVPTASQLSRKDTIDFNNTLGDLQRALDLLSPRHSSQKRRTRQGPRSSTATEDSVIPTVGDSQSSITPAYIRYGVADVLEPSQEETPSALASAPAPNVEREGPAMSTAPPLAAAVAQDFSMSIPRWDPPVQETSTWSTEPTPVTTSTQWGEGPAPTWQADDASQTSRAMDSVPWPRDSVQSQTSWSRSSMPHGPDEMQKRDSQSLLASQLSAQGASAWSAEPPIPSAEPDEKAKPPTEPLKPFIVDVAVPPHDGAWSVRWDPPSSEQLPPPPPPKDEEASQAQWLSSPGMPPMSSDDASMQLESVLANLRPHDAPSAAPAQTDEWIAWSGASVPAASWPVDAQNVGGVSEPRAPSEAPMDNASTHPGWTQPAAPSAPEWPPAVLLQEPQIGTDSVPPREVLPMSASQGASGLSPSAAAWPTEPPMPVDLTSGRMTPPTDGPMPISSMSPMSPNLPAPLPRTSSGQDLHRLSTSPPPKGGHFLSKMSPKFKWPRRKRDDKRQGPMQVSAPIQSATLEEDASHLSLPPGAQGPGLSSLSMPSPPVWDGSLPPAQASSPQPSSLSLASSPAYNPSQPAGPVPATASGASNASPLLPNEERLSSNTSYPSLMVEEPSRRLDPNASEPSTLPSDMYRASNDGIRMGPSQS